MGAACHQQTWQTWRCASNGKGLLTVWDYGWWRYFEMWAGCVGIVLPIFAYVKPLQVADKDVDERRHMIV